MDPGKGVDASRMVESDSSGTWPGANDGTAVAENKLVGWVDDADSVSAEAACSTGLAGPDGHMDYGMVD